MLFCDQPTIPLVRFWVRSLDPHENIWRRFLDGWVYLCMWYLIFAISLLPKSCSCTWRHVPRVIHVVSNCYVDAESPEHGELSIPVLWHDYWLRENFWVRSLDSQKIIHMSAFDFQRMVPRLHSRCVSTFEMLTESTSCREQVLQWIHILRNYNFDA